MRKVHVHLDPEPLGSRSITSRIIAGRCSGTLGIDVGPFVAAAMRCGITGMTVRMAPSAAGEHGQNNDQK